MSFKKGDIVHAVKGMKSCLGKNKAPFMAASTKTLKQVIDTQTRPKTILFYIVNRTTYLTA
jgi:hypothetical protein